MSTLVDHVDRVRERQWRRKRKIRLFLGVAAIGLSVALAFSGRIGPPVSTPAQTVASDGRTPIVVQFDGSHVVKDVSGKPHVISPDGGQIDGMWYHAEREPPGGPPGFEAVIKERNAMLQADMKRSEDAAVARLEQQVRVQLIDHAATFRDERIGGGMFCGEVKTWNNEHGRSWVPFWAAFDREGDVTSSGKGVEWDKDANRLLRSICQKNAHPPGEGAQQQ
jgi:hypothetical protein